MFPVITIDLFIFFYVYTCSYDSPICFICHLVNLCSSIFSVKNRCQGLPEFITRTLIPLSNLLFFKLKSFCLWLRFMILHLNTRYFDYFMLCHVALPVFYCILITWVANHSFSISLRPSSPLISACNSWPQLKCLPIGQTFLLLTNGIHSAKKYIPRQQCKNINTKFCFKRGQG